MAGEWRTATVTELQREGVLLVEDGNHGEYRPRSDEFVDNGVAFVRAADMEDGRVLFHSAAKINERARQRITKGIGAPGDVLLSHKGTVGKVAMVPDDAPSFVCSPQTTFWRTRDERKLDRQYLYAFLRSPIFHAQLATRAGETDMAPYVSLTSQRGLAVTLPPLPEQRAIAHILGTLDDKIELNRRMSEMLEVMARALFKSWFVDFDPVRAKAEGREPGLPQPLADLFPARLVDSDLGEIPEGWGVGPLKSVVVLQRGFDLPAPKRTSGLYPVLAASGPSGTHSEFMVRGPGVTTGRSGVLGRVFYVHDDFWPLNTSLWVKEFRHSVPAYAFHLLGTLDFESFNAGSAVPTLNRNHVHTLPTLLPPMEIIATFERLAVAGLRSQKHGDDQSRSLAALRDTLLPRLISGELKVGPRLIARPERVSR
jgi:type I restriction enzyme, S subunit